MDKIRIVHLIRRLEPLGYSRTALDIITRANAAKYEFFILTGRRPRHLLTDKNRGPFPAFLLSELDRNISLENLLQVIFGLHRILKAIKPDLVHIHSLRLAFVGSVAARLSGVPSVLYSSYGLLRSYKKKKRRRNFDFFPLDLAWLSSKIASSLSDLIVTITPHGLEEELSLGLAPRSKYRVIYNAIQPERLSGSHQESGEVAKYRLGLDAYFPILGTATRLDHEKGIEFLIEAVAGLRSSFPDILLLVVGDGPRRENLLVLAKRLGVMNHVRFLGLRDDVPALLGIFDIFVLPSLYEATGIVLAEAMACAKPVVTTRVGGLPEIIKDGEDGFLVPPGDAAGLAEKIALIARDRELARRIGAKAADKARKLFDMQKMINDYEGLYQSLLKRKESKSAKKT